MAARGDPLIELDEPGEELRERLRVLWRRRFTVAAVTAVAVGAAAAVTLLAPAQYRSTTKIVVTRGGTLPRPDAKTGELPFARTLGDLVKTQAVAQNVVQNLRLERTPAALLDDVRVDTAPSTSVITISYTDSSGERAQQVTQELALVFVQLVAQRLGQAAAGEQALAASIWEPATPPASTRDDLLRNVLIALVLGFAVAVAAAFARDRLDGRVRARSELERAFGAPVVAEVGGEDGFDALAARLPYLSVDRPAHALLVAGDAALAVARGLAAALARTGERPVLVDAAPAADGRRGLSDVLAGEVELERALVPDSAGVAFLGGGTPAPDADGLLGGARAAELVDRLAALYTRVLVAGPPEAAPAADAVLVAAGPDGVRRAVARGLRLRGARVVGIVLAGAAPASRKRRSAEGPAAVEEL